MQNNISAHVHSLILQSVFYEQQVILTHIFFQNDNFYINLSEINGYCFLQHTVVASDIPVILTKS